MLTVSRLINAVRQLLAGVVAHLFGGSGAPAIGEGTSGASTSGLSGGSRLRSPLIVAVVPMLLLGLATVALNATPASAAAGGSSVSQRTGAPPAGLFAAPVGQAALSAAPGLTPSRTYTSSFGAFAGPAPQALAVDQQNGDVYAVDGFDGVVDRFAADGSPDNFTAGPDAGTNTLTVSGLSPGNDDAQVAVDNSGGPADGTVYVTGGGDNVLRAFARDGTSLGALTGSSTPAGSFTSPCGVAVDQGNGDLYIADEANRIWRYSPSGAAVAEGDYAGGIDPGYTPCQMAADAGEVYAVDWGTSGGAGGSLQRFDASAFSIGTPLAPTGIEIDPTARAVATDPASGDVYADEGDKIAVYHSDGTAYYTFGSSDDFGLNSSGVAVKSGGAAYVADRHAGGHQGDVFAAEVFGHVLTVVKAGAGTGTVTSSPPGIDCGATCSATLVEDTITLAVVPDTGSALKSWSGCAIVNGDQCTVDLSADRTVTATFSTSPTVDGETADPVGTTEATLRAHVHPQDAPTTFHFEYGSDPSYGHATAESSSIGSDGDDHPVTAALSGLEPATTYHFRVVATNANGVIPGPDQTFTTHASAPAFSACDNDSLRTGDGKDLPDCRAYEQASPVDKNGNDIQGGLYSFAAALDGDGVTFGAFAGLPGAVGAQDYTMFMARRTDAGWSSGGLFPPQAYGPRAKPVGWTQDLKYSFASVSSRNSPIGEGQALAERDSLSGAWHMIHSYTSGRDGNTSRFVAASADDSKIYFQHGNNPLTPDAPPDSSNLYVWDRDTGTIRLAGVLPADSCATPPCVDLSGTTGGDGQGVFHDFFAEGANTVSDDGAKAFFTSQSSQQVYVRKNAATLDATTEQMSASHRTDCAAHDPCSGDPEPDPLGVAPAQFQGATPDGAKALFTSSEKLTDDATTGPNVLPSHVARANLPDAATVDDRFLPAQRANDLKRDGNFVYWVDSAADKIGRADVSAADCDPAPAPCHVTPDFITGADNPQRVAFYAGQIYWTNAADRTLGHGSIGRADIPAGPDDPAANVDENYIDTSEEVAYKWANVEPDPADNVAQTWDPAGIAFDASGHLYWGALQGSSNGGGRDGLLIRSNADGSDPMAWPRACNTGQDPLSCPPSQLYNRVDFPRDITIDGTDIFVLDHETNDSGSVVTKYSTTDQFANQTLSTSSDDSGRNNPGDSLSVDASHVYWTEGSAGAIGRVDRDGSNADPSFITDLYKPQALVADASSLYYSNLSDAGANPGTDLYSYDTASGELTDLTPDPTDANGADVQGVLGASDDGSFVYFVANGDLDGSSGQATVQGCRRTASPFYSYVGLCNLYLWHDGAISYIATLDPDSRGPGQSDAANWRWETGVTVEASQRVARVSADGETLVFRSNRQLTSYDNTQAEPNCGDADARCNEFYRFHFGDPGVTCITCDPTGARPRGDASLQNLTLGLGFGLASQADVVSRNLSSDGNRFFFETSDRLLPSDTNGLSGCAEAKLGVHARDCQDIYEWEADGSGSCQSASQNGGCLYLITTGKGAGPVYFVDASQTGDDVFFLTRDSLVHQDGDSLLDVYDARVGGGLSAQQALPPAGCSDGCQGSPAAAPVSPVAGTVTFAGVGNAQERQPARSMPRVSVSKEAVKGSSFVLAVKVPAAGTVRVSGGSVRSVSRVARKAGSLGLRVRLSAKAKSTLKKKKRLVVKLKVTFKPTSGSTSTASVSLTVKA